MLTKVIPWKVTKSAPEPTNSAKVIEDMKAELLRHLRYIKTIFNKKGDSFLLGDQVKLSSS